MRTATHLIDIVLAGRRAWRSCFSGLLAVLWLAATNHCALELLSAETFCERGALAAYGGHHGDSAPNEQMPHEHGAPCPVPMLFEAKLLSVGWSSTLVQKLVPAHLPDARALSSRHRVTGSAEHTSPAAEHLAHRAAVLFGAVSPTAPPALFA